MKDEMNENDINLFLRLVGSTQTISNLLGNDNNINNSNNNNNNNNNKRRAGVNKMRKVHDTTLYYATLH